MRVNDDIRLIVHRTASSLLLAYVGHHDDAYAWAERRQDRAAPDRPARRSWWRSARRVEEIVVADAHAERSQRLRRRRKPPLFADMPRGRAARLWRAGGLAGRRAARPPRTRCFDLAAHLPQEAAEALLNLATGGQPALPPPAPADADPFAHPDAQRRFRVLTNVAELERALDYPWEKWTVFLHPAQRQFVERDYTGPARISGSAGTGKTIVALHRAVYLARANPEARVLLTTFSKPLANALQVRLRAPDRATSRRSPPASTWSRSPASATTLQPRGIGQPNIASPTLVEALLREAAAEVTGHRFAPQFLFGEWRDVVDAWQLRSWEAYRDVSRLGRKTRHRRAQRELLWAIFERVRQGLRDARRSLGRCCSAA